MTDKRPGVEVVGYEYEHKPTGTCAISKHRRKVLFEGEVDHPLIRVSDEADKVDSLCSVCDGAKTVHGYDCGWEGHAHAKMLRGLK